MSLIELDRVGFRYGRSPAVQNLSLAVEEGSSLGLIGPNGCGKSTILKLVATLLRPSQGRVVVSGFDSRFDARNVRRRIGYVPEQLGVYPNLSVWQYLSFFARCAGLPVIERKSTLETLLRVVDLHDQRQLEAHQLSRGMRRRLALARALVHNPAVLLLDDPLGGLDGRGRLELIEVLKELRGMGITVLMSGHLLGDIVQLCSHVAILREGALIRSAAVADLVREELAAARRVEIEVLLGEEMARAALAMLPEVRDVGTDGRTISFRYHGDLAGLSTVLGRLVADGVHITRFGPGPERFDELAAGLAETNGKAAV
jgi:ABC-2 type transport system ATP-binding protein